MTAGRSTAQRAVGQARHVAYQARRAVRRLQPPRQTALRLPVDRRPPLPSEFARFGARSFVVPPARVVGPAGIELGDDVVVLEDSGLSVDVAAGARLVLGDRVRLAPGAEITCTIRITIGEAVSSSDYVAIADCWGPFAGPSGAPPPPPGAPVVVEPGAYLGWGSFVGPGVTVGRGAFVGEGAVVLDDVPPHTVVYGNPARVVRELDPTTGRWHGPRFPTRA